MECLHMLYRQFLLMLAGIGTNILFLQFHP